MRPWPIYIFLWSAMHDWSPIHIFGGLGLERRYRRDRAQSSYQKGIGGASSSWKEWRRGGERASSWACLSPSSARRASKRYLCARVAVGLKKRGICCHHNTTSICDLPPPPEVFLSWEDCQKSIPSSPHSVLHHITSTLVHKNRKMEQQDFQAQRSPRLSPRTTVAISNFWHSLCCGLVSE